MRTSFFITLSICVCSVAYGHTKDSTFVFSGSDLINISDYQGMAISAGGFFRSSGVSTHMASDYLFSDHFTRAAKDQFLQSGSGRTRINANVKGELRYFSGNDSMKNWWIGLDYEQRLLFDMGKEMSQLLLFGNKNFAGKNIRSEDNAFLSYERYSLLGGIQHQFNARFHLQLYGGISTLGSYRYASAGTLGIYTQEDGDYLDLSMDQLRLYQSEELIFGLTGGLKLAYRISENTVFSASIDELSLYFGDYYERQYSFHSGDTYRFEGLKPGFEQLFSADWSNLEDSLKREVLKTDSGRVRTFSLPSNFTCSVTHNINEKNAVNLSASGRGWIRFGYAFSGTHIFRATDILVISSSLGFGNFSGLVWSESMELALPGFNLCIDLYGINGMVLPLKSGAYGLAIGLFRAF